MVSDVQNITEGYSYEIFTSSAFSAVTIHANFDANDVAFKLSGFAVGQVLQQPIPLAYNITGSDFDGDTVGTNCTRPFYQPVRVHRR